MRLLMDQSAYFRPPYEDCHNETGCASDMQALGYHTITQNVWTNDYINYNASTYDYLVGNFTEGISGWNASNNHIIYAHEQEKPTVYNLTEYMIQTLAKEGYKFVTVGECLGDAPENWYRNGTTGEAVTVKPFGVEKPQAPLTLNTASSHSNDSSSSGGSGSKSSSGGSTGAGNSVTAPAAAAVLGLSAMYVVFDLIV